MQDKLKERIEDLEEISDEEIEKITNFKKEMLLEEYKANYFIKKCIFIYKTYKEENKDKELDLASLCYIHNFANDIDITTAEEDEERIEAYRSYINEIDLIAQELTLEELEEAIDFYNDALLFTNEELYKTLALAFYLIKKYKGTPKATRIIELLRSYKEEITEQDLEQIKEPNSTEEAEKNIEVITEKYIITNIKITLYRFLLTNTDSDYKELIKELTKDDLETRLIEAEEVSTDLEKTTETILNNYETINIIRNRLNKIAEEDLEALLESKEVNNIINDAKSELGKIDTLTLLNNSHDKKYNNTYNILYNAFSSDPIIKKEIKEPLEIDEKAIEELIDKSNPYKKTYIRTLEGEIIEEKEEKAVIDRKKLRIRSLDNGLEDIEEPIGITEEEENKARLNEWLKTNVSEPNTDIKKIEHLIARRTRTPKQEKIARLNELKALYDPTEEELAEIKELEEDIKQDLQIEKEILDNIELNNLKLKEKEEELAETPSYKIDKIKMLKSDIKKLKENSKKLQEEKEIEIDQNNKPLQIRKDLATGLDLVDITNGKLQATMQSRYLGRKAEELERLSYFLEDRFYNMHEEDKKGYISFSFNDYAEATGRTNKSELREKMENALDLKASMTFKVNTPYKNFNISGEIKTLGTHFKIEPREEKNGIENNSNENVYIVYLDQFYRDAILWKGKGDYWASIPRKLMKIDNPLARGLGFYLYETLRKGLKGEGYYIRKFYMETIIEEMEKKGLLATGKTIKYSVRVINPLKEAFSILEQEELISTNNESPKNPFNVYENELLGKRHLEERFKEQAIIIKFLVYDKETYDKVNERNNKKKTTRK